MFVHPKQILTPVFAEWLCPGKLFNPPSDSRQASGVFQSLKSLWQYRAGANQNTGAAETCLPVRTLDHGVAGFHLLLEQVWRLSSQVPGDSSLPSTRFYCGGSTNGVQGWKQSEAGNIKLSNLFNLFFLLLLKVL